MDYFMMTSTKPYLLRAFYEWIVDNNLTPYILVNTEMRYVQVPRQYVEDGKIILNISPTAAHSLQMNNDWIEFNARFSGSAMHVTAPIQAVMAIYARENGRGIVFEQEEADDGDSDQGGIPPHPPKLPTGKKPKLTVVKGGIID